MLSFQISVPYGNCNLSPDMTTIVNALRTSWNKEANKTLRTPSIQLNTLGVYAQPNTLTALIPALISLKALTPERLGQNSVDTH
jgi:hypothetical protein